MRAVDAICLTVAGLAILTGVVGLLEAFWPVGCIALGAAVLAGWFLFVDDVGSEG